MLMADFCWDCTKDMWPDVDPARNDFAGVALREDVTSMLIQPCGQLNYVVWLLCEGCGSHVFDDKGKRVCEWDGLVRWDACPKCMSEVYSDDPDDPVPGEQGEQSRDG